MRFAVLGDGAWGTAVAALLLNNGHDVTLWGPFPDYIETMKQTGKNIKFLPILALPSRLRLTSNINEAVGNAEVLIIALPSQYVRNLFNLLRPIINTNKHIILDLAKGIEIGTLKRVSEIVSEILGDVNYSVLSGPSHAEEVCKNIPTAVVIGTKNRETGTLLQNAFMNENFRVYLSDDPTGVELGGALKNVYAIAAGIADGMGIGDNPKAALITRSIAEMSRLGKALGGRYETFSGLSGIGDLIVTCISKHSRNRAVGEKLGKGLSLAQILKELGMVIAEGVTTTESAYKLVTKHGIEAPIVCELYETLYKSKKPKECLFDLMNREAKTEIY